jgi:hypothetical protein
MREKKKRMFIVSAYWDSVLGTRGSEKLNAELAVFAPATQKKPMTFERGTVARAKRDVLARQLAKHKRIKTPYALATHQIKKGVKVRPMSEVVKELRAQVKIKRRHLSVERARELAQLRWKKASK